MGWNTWEDIDVADRPGINFGWPCYQGLYPNPPYPSATPPHHGCASIGTPDNPGPLRDPLISWSHSDPGLSTPAGFMGNVGIGGVFYTGNQYPLAYRGRYFYGDFAGSWIAMATLDASNRLTGVSGFATNADSPVDFETDPWTGDLYYAAIYAGEVRRIRYIGPSSNRAPRASIDSPIDQSNFAAGDTIPLIGSGNDHEDPSSALVFEWWVDGAPDGVIEPDAWSFVGRTARFVPEAQPPGSQRRYEVHLVVWDTQGRSDTTGAQVIVHWSLAVPEQRLAASLSAAFPNPSAGGVAVSVELATPARVAWAVHDLLGREIWREPARLYGAGNGRLAWNGRRSDGRRLGPGLYFARISVGGRTFVRRIALMR